jgi:hypothetical protein
MQPQFHIPRLFENRRFRSRKIQGCDFIRISGTYARRQIGLYLSKRQKSKAKKGDCPEKKLYLKRLSATEAVSKMNSV